MAKEDGGPAFPAQDSGDTGFRPGMTLRDYFAAKALSGLMSRGGTINHVEPDEVLLAKSAYVLADAMIAERSK